MSHRVAARFDEAVQLAEVAFIEEMSRLVSHLTERISGSDDGQPKVFRNSAIENITEFFQRTAKRVLMTPFSAFSFLF